MRLIDADALNADFIQNHTANTDVYLTVRKIIDNAPAVDVVEVVRCKDCVEYIPWLDGKICARIGSYFGNTKPNDFCSFGERKVSE